MTRGPATKLPYDKPAIKRVNIVAEEMAVAGCKTQTTKMGPNGSGCFFDMCKFVGS